MSGPKALLKLRVVPNARRSEVVGEYGEAIKLKIAAPAVDGKANEALLEFIAEELAVPRRTLELVTGEKSRDKMISIDGLDLPTARARLLSKA
jgi:uncharacterized protein